MEGCWIKRGEEPTERVMRGNALGQLQKRRQPLLLGPTIALDISEAFGTCDDRADGDSDDVDQQMIARALNTWIRQALEILQQRGAQL